MRPSPALLLESIPGQWAFARWNNVGIVIWSTPASEASARRVSELSCDLRDEHPHGYSLMHVIEPKSGLAGHPARRVFAARIGDHVGRVVAIDVVIEDVGFAASALRSLVTGILMMAAHHAPVFVDSNTDAACDRIVREHLRRGQHLDREAMGEALAQLREAS